MMIENDLIATVAVVVGYILFQNRTLRYAKPLARDIDRSAKHLLKEPLLGDQLRQSVEFMADYAANPWVAPILAIGGVFCALLVALRIVRLPEHQVFPSEEVAQRYRYMDAQFTKSVIAANPLGGFVLLNAMLLMISILAIAGLSWEIYEELKTMGGAATTRLHDLHWHGKAA